MKWVPISECFPRSGDVIVFDPKHGGVQPAVFHAGTKEFFQPYGDELYTVTHWMLYPRKPRCVKL